MSASPAEPILVLLAAGASERLGTAKALVEIGEGPHSTPLARLLRAGASIGAEPPLVVTGAHSALITHALPDGVRVIHNVDWRAGRTGGVLLAHRAYPDRDLCLAPVDVPLVCAKVFRTLADSWLASGSPDRGWLGPWVRTQTGRSFGHPVILGRRLLDDLEGEPSDRSLRELRERADPCLAVEVRDPAILDDLDLPAHLELLRRRVRAAGSSDPKSR